MKVKKFNIRILISTVFIGCAAFSFLIIIENKILSSTLKKEVIIASKDIKQGTKLSDYNTKKSSSYAEGISSNSVISMEEIKNKYAIGDIYKGEVLNRQRISDKSDNIEVFLRENEKEVSIPLAKFNNDAFAGTMREGDTVDIIHTNIVNEEAVTDTIAKKTKVIGAVDSEGKLLKKQDKNILAASVIFSVSEEEAVKIAKESASGYFTIDKSSILKR
ncbi:Flp pilus assembly protein CpaB [Clostridium felsineum]|uniref:SAF domain-containing protein n=1 Tax=Clostridium felsineum TaxID=36839 RepID=A0A1S8LDU9_9CLOT|nr:RcpC/CpaB family pilus assembly protein [Clostridium felsineum]MCR3761444.1 hypothetical protein [Clostridium felsineum]URZ06722.1 hypothetical protein CLROS_020550 [Clostridium felsineum]URZ11755.1 hypothetical protein CROST_024720 [Clostridium felsineum]URZ16316.1 hypothetical protein CLFE_023630 [Clostridium felsineum DSM 794]